MPKLEHLLEQLCPNGVEYRKLGELGTFYGGITGKSKEDFKEGNAKFITYKNVYANPALQVDVPDRVRIGEKENQRTLEYGDVIFTGSSETPDECGISSVVTTKSDEKLYLNSFCFFFRLNDKTILLPDFSKHLFRSNYLRYQIGKTASGVTRFNVSKDRMKKVCIPIPPIGVQTEIVRILDKFTELTTELTTELANRKKQYEHYENTVLFDNNYPRIKLQELCTVNQGLQIPISERFRVPSDNRYIYITVQYLKNPADNQYYIENPNDSVICHEDDILVTRTGSTGTIVTGIIGCFHNNFFKVQCNGRVLKKYMLVLLRSKTMYGRMQKAASGGNIMDLPHKKFYNLEVPLPAIEEQQRIVDVLDRFDKLCNDITEGLPAEIEARQKQYEYYRDKLLRFKEVNK